MSNKLSLAIIINRFDFRENDILVCLYSQEFGKLNLLAKGAKKIDSKLAAHLEPLTLSKVLIIPGKGFDYLASAISQDYFINIKEDLDRYNLACYILKIFNSSIKENETDQVLFNYLLNYLYFLNQLENKNLDIFLSSWLLGFLNILGYKPHINNCLLCQNKLLAGTQVFNLKLGGLVCPKCYGKYSQSELLKVSESSIKLMRLLSNKKGPLVIKKSLVKELENLLIKFWKYQDLDREKA
jgi:DNA repair protein RecO (recombination protein O)